MEPVRTDKIEPPVDVAYYRSAEACVARRLAGVARAAIAGLAASAILLGCSRTPHPGATGSFSGQNAFADLDDRAIARNAAGRTAKVRISFQPGSYEGPISDYDLMVTDPEGVTRLIRAFEHTKFARTSAGRVTEPVSTFFFVGANGEARGNISVNVLDLDTAWSPEVKRLYLKYRHRWVLRERAKGSKIRDLK